MSVIADVSPDRCKVYVVAAFALPVDYPTGDCSRCGAPLRDHPKRVSSLVPQRQTFIVDEDVWSV